MEGDGSFDADKISVVPSEFQDYLKGMDMQDIQPIQSTSPIHRVKSAQSAHPKPDVSKPIYRATSADNLSMSWREDQSLSPHSSHNTSLDDFKAKAKRKGIVPLPSSPSLNLVEELKIKQSRILQLQKENEELKDKLKQSYEGACKDDFLSQIETISKLKLDCVLKQNEVDRLKAVELTLKQTKQVLKDTTWALTVKEEELKNIKADMRDNYESRLNELITRLNDRELKLNAMKNERDTFSEKNRDLTLRVDELSQQISCYEQELEAKNKQIDFKAAEIKGLEVLRDQIYLDSAHKTESLMVKLREMEQKIENAPVVQSITEECEQVAIDDVETVLPTTEENADQSLDAQENKDQDEPDPDTMSLEQITLMIQDNANLRLVVEEGRQKLQFFMEESEGEKKELQKEVAQKGDQINELMQLVNTIRAQMPLNDTVEVYSTGIDADQEQDEMDEVRSCASDDEGNQQMSHIISNYEKQINELQKLYDQDVFSLENDNVKLKKEIKELQSNYLNVSHSNTSFAMDFEDMKTTYNDKIDHLKTHYEDLLRKECVSSQKQQTELLAENNKLQLIVEEAEKKFMQHIQHMEANINSNYHTELTGELQKIFAKQTSSISAIKEDLQRELNDIKSTHCEDLCTVEQEFGLHEINKSGLEDTYSNEILKLTEERNIAQKTAHLLKDELLMFQQEYDSLKELYDSLSFDVGQYKNEKSQLLSQISVLSEESSNLKSSLRTRRNEVEEYKTKITDASKTIEDYTKKLIGKSERSSNASDSLRSELEELSLDFSSPRAPVNKTVEMQKKSNLLSAQVKLLRSNLDEAKSELQNLYEEHGLSTAVYDRLTNILNLLKKYIESDILEQGIDIAEDGGDDKDNENVIVDPAKLIIEDTCKEKRDREDQENLCDDVNPPNTFEISENLSLDDDDLSDTTAVSDNGIFTQLDFEKELRDLKIDIPLEYCNSTLKQAENKDDTSNENINTEMHNLRKENSLLQQKIYSLSSDHIDGNIGCSIDFFHREDTSLSEGKLDTLKHLLDNIAIFEGNDNCGFKKCSRNDFTENILNEFKSSLDLLQQDMVEKEFSNDDNEHSISPKESIEIIESLQMDNKSLKKKIDQLEKDIFDRNLQGDFVDGRGSSSVSDHPTSTSTQTTIHNKIPLENLELYNMHQDNASLKVRCRQLEHEIVVPGFSSVVLFDELSSQALWGGSPENSYLAMISDNLSSGRDGAGTSHEVIEDEFDWDNSSAEPKHGSPRQMDSEGHTLKQRDSLSRSLSDLEQENEDLKKENISLKEEVERDNATIIGPGFASEILYYEHAQPVDGNAVGIKVNAIKSLLNNVVVNQGNEAVSFHEYEGRDVILRLLLDIQVEVVDLIKENNVLKEETVKQKPVNSCSVQTGNSLTEAPVADENNDSVMDDDTNLSLNNFLILDGSDSSSLTEHELLECEESNVIGTDKDVDVEHETLKPEFTSTVKDTHDCEIVNLGGENANIILKMKDKEKKVMLPAFSSVCFSSGNTDDITTRIGSAHAPEIPLSQSDLQTEHLKDNEMHQQLKQTSKALVDEVMTKAVTKMRRKSVGDSSDSLLDAEKQKITIVPGFNSDTLLQEQSITSAAVGHIDSLGMLVENLLIFEGNEDRGYKTSDGNEFIRRFLNDCQTQLANLRNENASLRLQTYPHSQETIGNQSNVANTSVQRGLLGEILSYTQHAAIACTKDGEVDDLRKDIDDIQEKIVRQQSFIIPGFSSELLQAENIPPDGTSVNDLPLLLENVAVFEGNDVVGFSKSEENDIANRVLGDFRVKIMNLVKENVALKGKVEKMQAICESRVNDEVITMEDVQSTFVSPSVSEEGLDPLLVPGFSSELLLNEDVLPFSEVDSSTRKFDALKQLLEGLVIFQGNDKIGYVKYKNIKSNVQFLNDLEIEFKEMKEENLRIQNSMQLLSTPELGIAYSQDLEKPTNLLACFSSENVNQENPILSDSLDTVITPDSMEGGFPQKPNFVPGFSSEMFHGEGAGPSSLPRMDSHLLHNLQKQIENLHKENELLKKCAPVPGFSSDLLIKDPTIMAEADGCSPEELHESQYAKGTKKELIDLLLKKDRVLDNLIADQSKVRKQSDHDDSVGAEYEESIRMSRAWMEAVNLQSLSRLREDLDEDYLDRIKVVEEKLREAYRGRIRKIAETCDQKVTQMKKDYEEEMRKIQESPDCLEETEASLGSYQDNTEEDLAACMKDDTKDDMEGDMSEDEIDTYMEMEGVSKDGKKSPHKTLSDKSVNTVASFESGGDSEQDEITKLKESLTELFRKPEVDGEDENILFRLDDVEGILHENYAKITDMTDKLKVKLYSIEKEMRKKFEDEKYKLIAKTKESILHDVAGVFTDLVDEQMEFVDEKVEKKLKEHGGLLLQAIEALPIQEGTDKDCGQEKGDLPEKFLYKIEEFFKSDKNILAMLEDKDKDCGVSDMDQQKIEPIQDKDAIGESIWKSFFQDKDSLPKDYQNELLEKKVEFKTSLEKDVNVLMKFVNMSFAKVIGQFSQYADLKTKLNTRKIQSDMVNSLASAHTDMVLKNSLQNADNKDSEKSWRNDILSKVGELMLKQMDPEKVNEQKLQFEELLQQHNSIAPVGKDAEELTKEKIEKELDDLSESCLCDAMQSLLEKETPHSDTIQHEGLKKQVDEILAQKVKQATDDKMEEFERAKQDMVKQHQFILDEFIAEQEKEIEDLRQEHSVDKENSKKGYVEQIYELQKSLEEKDTQDSDAEEKIKAEFQDQLEELKRQHNDELSKQNDIIRLQFEEEHIENLNNLQKQIEDDHAEHLRLLADCQQKQTTQIQDLKNQHDSLVQGIQVDHSQEVDRLKDDIRVLEDQCSRISGYILEDKEALEKLRNLTTLDDDKDSESLTSISESEDMISTSILNCYNKTKEHLKDQCNSQVDSLLKVFESVLGNISSEMNDVAIGPGRSDIQLTERTSSKQTLEDLLSTGNLKPNIHSQIEEVFQELSAEYEKWNTDINTKIDGLTEEVNQLKDENLKIVEENQAGDQGSDEVCGEVDKAVVETEAKLQRLQRQEEESSNFINILNNDIKKITDDRDNLKEEFSLLKLTSKDIVATVIKSEELLHEKLDEIIDNQLSGCNLSQYGLDTSTHSQQGKDVDGSLTEMPLNLAVQVEEPDLEPEFLKGVSSRFSETVDHFLQVLSLVFSDVKNSSQNLNDMESTVCDEETIEEDRLCEVNAEPPSIFTELEDKVNKNLNVTKEIASIKESINEKDVLISNLEKENQAHCLEIEELQGSLDKSLNEEDRLESFIEIQDRGMTDLENRLTEESKKSKDLLAAKGKVEKDIEICRQQISYLEKEIELKSVELEELKDALEEKVNKEGQLESFIEKQDALKKELENQLNSKEEKIKELVAANEELQKSKERNQRLVMHLERTCSNQTNDIEKDQVTLNEQGTEIEALKCAIRNQQVDLDKLKEQLIKKQMLMDAKECQLIEMEEQLKKENQKHLTEMEGVFDDQNATKLSLQEKAKEVKDLKDFIESKEILVSELEDQLSHKEQQCADLTDDLSKQKEKYELEYKQLATDKSKEISAIFKELEETLREKDGLENLMKSQEVSALKLTDEFEKLNTLNNAKEAKMAENEEQLKEEIAQLQTDLANVTTDLEENTFDKHKHKNDCMKLEEEVMKYKALLNERQVQLEGVEERLMKEKEKYALDLKNMTSKNLEELTSIQSAFDQSMSEKSNLEDTANKYQEEWDRHDQLIKEKDAELAELQEQLTKQKDKHASDLKELSDCKGKEITAIFNELEEKLREKDVLEDLVKKQEASISKMLEQLSKHSAMNNTKDAKMNEREEMLKKEIAKLQADVENMNTSLETVTATKDILEEAVSKHQSVISKRDLYLKECHKLIDEKQAQCAELEDLLSREKENLDNLTATKNEELANTQIALEEISRQKDEVEDLVNLKQAYISKLEEQLKEAKMLVDQKVAMLAGVEEHLAREKEQHAKDLNKLSAKKTEELNEEKSGFEHIIKKQLADIGELDQLKQECEIQIKEKQDRLSEIEEELLTERKIHSSELANLTKEKNEEIAALQVEIGNLQGEVGGMERQLVEVKKKYESEDVVEEKDKLAELINKQQADISKLEEQLNMSNNLVEGKQKELSDVQEQLIEELNKSAMSLQDLSLDKSQEIDCLQDELGEQKGHVNELQITIDQMSQEKIQMENVLKKQQSYIGELEEQMRKSKSFIDEKQIQLDGIEAQLMQAKLSHAADLEKISIDFDEKIVDNVGGQQATICKLQEQLNQQKVLLDEKDLQITELEKVKEECLAEIDTMGSENREALDTLQNTLEEHALEKDELELSIENQRALMSQLEDQLTRHKALIESKESQFVQHAEQLSKEKDKEVTDLLNESAELKDMMLNLRESLDEKVSEEAALTDMLEKEKAFNADLEKQINEKSDDLVALKQQMEKETTQHLSDLEQISVVKDEMIETIQKTLEDQSKEKVEFEKVVDNQSAIIAGLEQQLSASKKLNDEKIVLLEERGQLIKSKENSISDLEKEVKEQMSKTDAVQKSLQDINEELQNEKNAIEESLQQKLIQLRELNELIIAQQEKISELDKTREELAKLSMDKQEEIVNIQKDLEEQSTANDELNKVIEELKSQINQTITELNENKKLLDDKAKHLADMQKQEVELMSNLSDTKDRLVTIKQALEEKVRQEADLNVIIEKQKNLIAELEKQVQELQSSLNAKNEELATSKKTLEEEKGQYKTKLQNTLLDHKEETENFQKQLERNSREKECLLKELELNSSEKEDLKCSFEDQQSIVCELEGQLEEYKDLLDTQTQQLEDSERHKEEKAKQIQELQKEQNDLKGKVGNLEKSLKEKAQQEIDLDESIKKQKTAVSELERKLQENQASLKDKNSELSNLKQQLSEERNQHMVDFEEAAAKQKETISNMEKVLDEEIKEKKELKGYIESQENLAEELKKQLSEHKLEIASKEKLIGEIKALHSKTLEKKNNEFEQDVLEKSEQIKNLENSLDCEIRKKNELTNLIKHQEVMIDDLEREMKEKTKKENDLVRLKEDHVKALKTQEAVTNKLEKQIEENKIKIAQQENELIEVNDQLDTFEKLKSEFLMTAKEKEHQITAMEKNISEQIRETDELKDIVKRQQALVCELEDQLNQEKTNTSSREKEMDEMRDSIIQRHKNQICELEKELKEEKEKLSLVESLLEERTYEASDAKEAIAKQKMKVTELEEHLNDQNILLDAKDHELIEAKSYQGRKTDNEKLILADKLNVLEEKILNLEYELKKKGEELGQLQKTHQEMQLSHINEIMKLNNEHRSQIGTLMEIPQKDRNIKVLLMDLQKEADEVLDLVLNVPEVNENTPAERIETLKATWLQEKEMLLSIIDDMRRNAKESTYTEMSAVSNPISTADAEDFSQDDADNSVSSNVAEIRHDGPDPKYGKDAGQPKSNRLQAPSETSTDTPFVNGHRHLKEAFMHDNGIVSEFEKLLNEESRKVEELTTKFEEEVRQKESIQMSHEVELAKVVERELNLKEKYLKVAELLQKEKNAKTRVMEMLNDAQRLNEIQSQNLEEVQNDKNSLLESYTIVSELENLLAKEKERVELINAKLEKERYEKSSFQMALDDEKEELQTTREREHSLKEKCIELNKLLLKETEDKRNIADTLENEKKLIAMEKKNLEQKESALNQRLAKLGDGNPDQKLKALKSWEDEVKKREKSLAVKEEKLKTLIKRIEQGYDILPQKQTKDSSPEKTDKGDDESNDWLKQIESNQLLDTRHLPLVADLNQKIKGLQKEKVKLADTLTDLKTEIIDYKQQLKDYQLLDKDNKKRLEDKEAKLNALSQAIHPTGTVQDSTLSADGQKLLNAGWTIAKVQRLYLKYFRAESFRKALVYQKRYLTLMVNENESNIVSGLSNNNINNNNNWMKPYKRRPSFKVVVLAVISIRRMKYLVKKYHRNLHKSSPEYQYKDKTRNSFKKKNAENVIDELDHSPPGSKGITENGSSENHVSSRGSTRAPHTTTTPSKGNSRNYVPPTTRLTLSEPANNLLTLNNHSERLNISAPPNNWLHKGGLHIDTFTGRNNMPSLSMDNIYASDDVPRSYPRPSGVLTEEVPSRMSGANGDATNLNTSRGDKTSYANRPFSSPPSPLLSSTSRDHVHEPPHEDANESLSSYIHTLETLQSRLKKVGYNDRNRPSLM